MSKRKNMHRYIPAVARWDRVIGLDHRTGDWDDVAATARLYAGGPPAVADAVEALCDAVKECREGFAANPSVPAMDEAMGLIAEAEMIFQMSENSALEALRWMVRVRWDAERAKTQEGAE